MSNDNLNLDPAILASLEEFNQEERRDNSAKRVLRVKPERGQIWIVRFLPVQLGPRKLPWAKVAQHWINSYPTPCVRHTGEDFGGNPQAMCALCNVADELNESQDRSVSSIGYKARAVTQMLMYCAVLKKIDQDDRTIKLGDDRWKMHEFWLTRPSYSDLMDVYKRTARKVKDGFMNLAEGSDIEVASKKSGLKFYDLDPGPLVTDDPPGKLQETVNLLWASFKFAMPKFLSTRDLEDKAEKLRESADGRGRGGGRGRDDDRGDDRRGRDRDDDRRAPRGRSGEDNDDRPVRRADDDDDRRPSRRDDDRGRDDDRVGDHREAPRSSPPRASREDDDSDTGPVAPKAAAPSVSAPPSVAPAAPPVARTAPPPPPARGPAHAVTSAPVSSSIDDDEHVPEERADPAPPKTPQVDDPPPVAAEGSGTPPKAASAPTVAARPSLSDRLRRGVRGADQREEAGRA